MPRSPVAEPAVPLTPKSNSEERKQRAICEKTRKSLIEKLDNWEDHKVWDEFYQTYWRLIFSVAILKLVLCLLNGRSG
jgi:RNA polymerase sigma-70 factor (ECF subfamily)